MKTENSIKKFLLVNSIVAMSALAILVIVVVYAIISLSILRTDKVYVLSTKGDLLPMQEMESRESLAIEMAHHLYMFIDNYYCLNQNNWERKIEKALWLGDFQKDFTNRERDGFYTNIIQWQVERKAELSAQNIQELTFTSSSSAKFKITFLVEESYTDKNTQTTTSKQYEYYIQGDIRQVDRNFPHNPHGLYITNFREDRRIELKPE